MLLNSVCLIPLLLLGIPSSGVLIRPDPRQRHSTFNVGKIHEALRALENLLLYLDKNRGSLIVDAMWGIRMIEGGLIDTLAVADVSVDKDIIDRVEEVVKYAGEVSKRGMFYAKRNSAVQYSKFAELLSRPWVYQNLVGGGLARVDSNLIFTEASKVHIKPRDSDYCLMGTIGSGPYEGKKCTITDKCWKQITDPGQKEYSITHQLLFFFLIKHFNCTESLQSKGKAEDIIEIVRTFCTNIYMEMEAMFDKGVLPGIEQDLIMEQITFCGGAGFVEDFIRPDILDIILDWQRADGCYAPYDGSHLPQAIKTYNENYRKKDPLKAGLESMNKNIFLERRPLSVHEPWKWRHYRDYRDQNGGINRKLLSEAELRDGCMMHMTSVAGGALTMHIRAILQHKLYTDFNAYPLHYQQIDYSMPSVIIVSILLVALFLVICGICHRPARKILWILANIRNINFKNAADNI